METWNGWIFFRHKKLMKKQWRRLKKSTNGAMLPLPSSLSTSSGKTTGFGKTWKLMWNKYFLPCSRSKIPCSWFKALVMRINLPQDLTQIQGKLKGIKKAILYSLNRASEVICLNCCKNVICYWWKQTGAKICFSYLKWLFWETQNAALPCSQISVL